MIRAFTILELIVVMVLSAILFGVALTAFELINQQFHQFDKTTKITVDRDQFSMLWKRDFDRAELIYINQNELTFSFDAYELYYTFVPEFVTRRHSDFQVRTDTFFLVNKNLQGISEQFPIYEGLVDKVIFELKVQELWLEITCRKNYSAYDRMMNN